MTSFKIRQGMRIAVLGFGVEGESAARFFLNAGSQVTVLDERKIERDASGRFRDLADKGVAYVYGPFRHLAGYDAVIVSPGIRTDRAVIREAAAAGVPVTTGTNIFLDLCPCPVIGVTGTKGKGTSALITEMLKAAGKDAYLGGNIGTPPLDFLHKLKPNSMAVLELSSFQLMSIRKSPHVAVILMVTSEHLDYHTDVEEYVSAKTGIVKYQSASDITVVNIDYPNSVAVAELSGSTPVEVSTRVAVPYGCCIADGNVVWAADGHIEAIIPTADIFIPGKHNWENTCAASAAAKALGVPTDAIRRILRTFRGLPHRIEFVRETGGVRYYDDSFSTTPETAIAAIQAFSQPKVVILGGSSKHSDFRDLGAVIRTSESIRAVIGIGAEWPRIKSEIKVHNPTFTVIEGLKTMEEIVTGAAHAAQPGDVVVLSPACASFDMFKNYKDRGNQFKRQVHALPG